MHEVKIEERPLIVGLVAGETSGDILGAGLIRALKQQVTNVRFVGIAGPLMQAEGCESWYKIEELSVMGIIEVLVKIPRLLHIQFNLIKNFAKLKPDVFVGIDFPDFNIFLEKKLKQIGIKTIHYVSPSIWAWRENRILKLGKAIDLVLTLLPFEKQFYDRYGILCRFVGHAMADSIPLYPDKQAARLELNIEHNVKCLVILPGSRKNEVKMLSAIFLHAALILKKDFSKLEILIPIANKQCRKQFDAIYRKFSLTLPLKILDGHSQLAMIAADVALLASGTASLECLLAKCPMVVGYRMKLLTYWIAKFLVKISFISLPNLLAGEALINEFIQQKCQAKLLANSLKSMLYNKKKVKKLKQTFLQIHKTIRLNANQQAANAILDLSKNK